MMAATAIAVKELQLIPIAWNIDGPMVVGLWKNMKWMVAEALTAQYAAQLTLPAYV